ncbi:putative 2-hydroxyacid dehydrogenase YoaD [Moorella thermoacetica]|uniref:Putative 2-hydroxyacid dehydrogenase YoaD n=1 Tax=Neomoorella thermoacetica TaxID=1525 RepID=A0A1J5JG13_NEOTH|nr:2-hydroxyacid dehydrogenase [Moorella thermoacetica]OIQ08141.1 putative 2-hydroxyacid dehydrogenase YoaD [Moorella thermoacetica]
MKITYISDKLVKKEIFEAAIRRHFDFIDTLQIEGFQVDWPEIPLQYGPEVREFVGTEEEVISLIADAEVFLTHVAPVTERVLASAPRLKVIGCARGGPVNINVNAATMRGIPVFYNPGRNAPVVAEFTVGLILAEVLNIARAHTALINGIWRGDYYIYENTGFELEGKIAGIIGLGAVGRRVAHLLKAFGMRILAFDPYVSEDVFTACGAEKVSLEMLLKNADVVTLHARHTPETAKIINNRTLALMKPTAYFVNTARGGLVDYEALYKSLKDKKIAGAALDVFDEEPIPPNSTVFSLDNVTITPHIGGASKETAFRSADILVAEVKKFLLGQPVQFCKNPEVLN